MVPFSRAAEDELELAASPGGGATRSFIRLRVDGQRELEGERRGSSWKDVERQETEEKKEKESPAGELGI